MTQNSAHALSIEVDQLRKQLTELEVKHETALREMGAMARLVDEAEHKMQDALNMNHHQYLRAEALVAEIDALRSSTSWRLTRPLRGFIHAIRALRRR